MRGTHKGKDVKGFKERNNILMKTIEKTLLIGMLLWMVCNFIVVIEIKKTEKELREENELLKNKIAEQEDFFQETIDSLEAVNLEMYYKLNGK